MNSSFKDDVQSIMLDLTSDLTKLDLYNDFYNQTIGRVVAVLNEIIKIFSKNVFSTIGNLRTESTSFIGQMNAYITKIEKYCQLEKIVEKDTNNKIKMFFEERNDSIKKTPNPITKGTLDEMLSLSSNIKKDLDTQYIRGLDLVFNAIDDAEKAFKQINVEKFIEGKFKEWKSKTIAVNLPDIKPEDDLVPDSYIAFAKKNIRDDTTVEILNAFTNIVDYELSYDNFNLFKRNIKKKLEILDTSNNVIVQNIKSNELVDACGIKLRKIIQYNCKMRLVEGYAINHSLRKMREDMKEIIKSAIKKTTNDKLPIVYYKDSIPYMSNNTYFLDKYEEFRKLRQDKEQYEYGEIFKILQNGGVDLEKTKFMFVTVINISDDANVPPNPPYIDITDLQYKILQYDRREKLHIASSEEIDKICEDATKIKDKIITYSYYKNQPISYKNSPKISIFEAKHLIELIKTTNPLSLIGTLETSTIVKNPFLNYTIGTMLDDKSNKNYVEFFKTYGLNIPQKSVYDISQTFKSLTTIKRVMLSSHIDYKANGYKRIIQSDFNKAGVIDLTLIGGRRSTAYYLNKLLKNYYTFAH
jgi:hypothetical protein